MKKPFVVTSQVMDETIIASFSTLPEAITRFGQVCFIRGATDRRGIIRVRNYQTRETHAEVDLSAIEV